MKRILAVTAALLALPLLNACSLLSHADDAEELRSALTGLSGVDRVELDYSEPATLDSGKLELRVAMSADANPADAVMVAARAYEGFAGPHRGEESDVFVTMGDDTIHVRSLGPDAKVTAVKQAAERAVAVLSDGAVRADINTQDVEDAPHVFTEYTVIIAEGDGDSVQQTALDLEQKYADIPDAAWRVQTQEDEAGWVLGSTSGFPSSSQRALYGELNQDLPRGASVQLVDDLVTVHLPDGAGPDAISAMAGRHLAALGGAEKSFYEITSGDSLVMTVSQGECAFTTDQAGSRLEKEHGADCSKVSRASE